MRTRLLLGLLTLSAAVCSGDRNTFDHADQSHADLESSADSGTIFALTPEARKALEHAANQGDSEAAFKIAMHYGMAGGDRGIVGDPKNSIEEDRWLKRSAELGNETAELNWAVKQGSRNCALARKTLEDLVKDSVDKAIREGAQSWLQSSSLCGRT
jgi:TPR repeat protein